MMDIYLASFVTIANRCKKKDETEEQFHRRISNVFLLTSFWEVYRENGEMKYPFWVFQKRHMLDSGAFSFINGRNNSLEQPNWDEYTERYAEYINKTNQKYFFELDIDLCVGLKKVETLRARLEKLTNKQCIPVWHKYRGKKYWHRMIAEYPYVGIGSFGFRANEYKPQQYHFMKWFIQTAHEQDCKVHGLGFTKMNRIFDIPFDSVDSTSWKGGRYGTAYRFIRREDGKLSLQNVRAGKNQRGKSSFELDLYGFNQWVRFQRYAEKYL